MAVPTITHNAPSEGFFTWGPFTIQYLGVGYSIPEGWTDQRWVWWRYNGGGGNSILEAGENVPLDLTDDDIVLFGNKGGVGIRVQSSNFVDGELIVDGTILSEAVATNFLYSGVVKAEQITTGSLIADVTISGSIATGPPGTSRVAMDHDGIVVYDANGIPTTTLGTSGTSTFKGQVETSSLTANNASLAGTNNEIASSGSLTIRSGVTAPSAAPVITQDWYTVQQFTGGLEYRDLHYISKWRATEASNEPPPTAKEDRVMNRSGTAGDRVFQTWIGYLSNKPGYYYLDSYGSSGTNYEIKNIAYYDSTATAALSNDGTDIYVTEVDRASKRFIVRKYSGTTLGFLTSWGFDAGNITTAYKYIIGMVYTGGFFYIATEGPQGSEVRKYDPATPATMVTNGNFSLPASASGFAHDGTNFWALTENGVIHRIENATLSMTGDIYAASTYYDNVGVVHETSASPVSTKTLTKGQRVSITVSGSAASADPEGPSHVRFYAGNVSSTRTNLFLQADGTKSLTGSAIKLTLNSLTLSGTNPPDPTNNPNAFPAGNPGKILATAGGFVLNGDSTGAWPYIQPVGAITMYGGATAPSGWLLCNGSLLPISGYQALFAVIGHKFNGGVDPGSGLFRTPDLMDRFPIGAGAFAVGAAGGSKTITVAQMPEHDHGGGSFTVHRRVSTGTNVGMAQGGGSAASSDASVAGLSGLRGSGQDYWQPYQAVSFIIKT